MCMHPFRYIWMLINAGYYVFMCCILELQLCFCFKLLPAKTVVSHLHNCVTINKGFKLMRRGNLFLTMYLAWKVQLVFAWILSQDIFWWLNPPDELTWFQIDKIAIVTGLGWNRSVVPNLIWFTDMTWFIFRWWDISKILTIGHWSAFLAYIPWFEYKQEDFTFEIVW